ncbi:MAG: hypothetical protein L6R39_005550 [Caloplaca ligustica]|nr:MAG: hypothetical protein L6R39_005550 [Caloplaca ligustica]
MTRGNFQPSSNPSQLPLTSPTAPARPSASSDINTVFDGDAAATKRRRTSTATSSRGVANLTPEQLAKKRANDREAQRAIRERTKTQIETLEKKIRELSNQQPHQELQNVLKQKQLVETENVHIKKKLSAALSLLQPLLGGRPGGAPSKQYHLMSILVLIDISSDGGPQSAQDPSSILHQTPAPHGYGMSDTASIRSRSSVSPTFAAPSPMQQQNQSPIPRMSTHQGPVYSPRSAPMEQQRNILTQSMNMNASGERLNLGFLLDGRSPSQSGGSPLPAYPRIATNFHATPPKTHEGFEPPLVAHNVPIRNISPTCPLDGILLDFLAERRVRAAEGVSPSNLVGPSYPSVSSLLNPERSIYSHPLSRVFTDILSKFPDLSTLPEQVAVLYVMFLIMRWQISPTPENYERLPDWVTPRASQLFTPHPAWVDHLPWPRMRDKMVHLYPEIPLDNFFIPYTTTLSLNWKYEPSDTLLSMPGSDEFSINPVFERHLRDLGNWSLGTAFEKAHPRLADTCKIKRDDRGK